VPHAYIPDNPLVVQSDRSILLEVESSKFETARDAIAGFAELVKSPEHVHTYRLTPLSLWNAAAAGLSVEAVVDALARFSKYDLPANVIADVRNYMERYGRLKLHADGDRLLLRSTDRTLLTELRHHKRVAPLLGPAVDMQTVEVDPGQRGHLKQALIKIGYPAEDLAGYVEGAPLGLHLRATTRDGARFALRAYQDQAAAAFYAGGAVHGGSGVVVLPCGAGKTVVGLRTLELVCAQTLILTSSTVAVRQWIDELIDKTDMPADQIGEYSGERKEIRPITVTTYQILTHRESKDGPLSHFNLFTVHNWGLIIYDEVHLLPAPVFRITAEIQARRRLGLTATLVREDGREDDVFSLIGPKKYDAPWKDLEQQGWIATAECHEIRLELPRDLRVTYAVADEREKYRVAAENPLKLDVVSALIDRHAQDRVLVIGQYIDQIETVAALLDAPLITGKTPTRRREELYGAFRAGEITRLVVSKVANFAIDLPDANVAIQISGSFGSRQEEAQRLGRILRPKRDGGLAHFYSVVTKETRDEEFSTKRQLFLTEQGYRYTISDADDLLPQALLLSQPLPLAGVTNITQGA
jgi:DNA excision repair protein ERCC-3